MGPTCTHRIYFGISWLSNEDVFFEIPKPLQKGWGISSKHDQPIQIKGKNIILNNGKNHYVPPKLEPQFGWIGCPYPPKEILLGEKLDFSQNLKVVNQPIPKNNEFPRLANLVNPILGVVPEFLFGRSLGWEKVGNIPFHQENGCARPGCFLF